MANQKTTRVKHQYFIPLEVTKDTVFTHEYENAPRKWSKIGNRLVKSILIPCTKEQYEAYMRPEWREDKRQQRLAEKRKRREKAKEEHRSDKSVRGVDTPVSFEQLTEMEYGFNNEVDQDTLESIVEKQELLDILHEELSELKELDRKIILMAADGYSEAAIGKEVGLSQKTVNRRKHLILNFLKSQLNKYR